MPAKVLLHVCCGPCSLWPILKLREEGFVVTALFYNPNIHPQEEYVLRRRGMEQVAHFLNLPAIWLPEDYSLAVNIPEWVNRLKTPGMGERCIRCYEDRLGMTARIAAQEGFAWFSTSLLYSRYQAHEQIIDIAGQASQQTGSRFVYRDFRAYWQQGIELSKRLGIYRQKWCGCILSRAEAENTVRPNPAPHKKENNVNR